MPRHALLASLVFLLLHAPGAAAQSIPSPYRYIEHTQSVALFAGWLAADQGDLETGPHAAPLVGARYGIRFSGPVSGEVGLSMSPTQRTLQRRNPAFTDSLVLGEPVGDVNALLLVAEAGLRFQLTGPRTWNGLAPYLALGGGLTTDLLGADEAEEVIEPSQRVDFGPGFAVSGGVGADWFLTERFSLRLEARDYLWRLAIPPGLTQARQEEEHEWTHNAGVTLGAALHF